MGQRAGTEGAQVNEDTLAPVVLAGRNRVRAPDLVIRAQRVLLADGIGPAAILIRHGVITGIEDIDWDGPTVRDDRLSDGQVLIPGLVDTHVHINEPGRTDWEGFDTATASAIAGGVTTLVDMPLNSLPPTLTREALMIKRKAARGRCRADVGFWGGATPTNLDQLADLLQAGVFGVKCFLQDSGVPEFPPLSPAELRRAAEIVAAVDGLLLVHAEDSGVLHTSPIPHGASYQAFLASRPVSAETAAIAGVIEVSRATGCRMHVVHLSSGAGAELIRQAKADGVEITAETCPHYLTISADDVPDGAPQFKCCPPIRGRADTEALWAALDDGTIDIVVTDHSPSTPELKLLEVGDLGLAWGGIASLQFGLGAVWHEARHRGFDLADVVRWMASGPADLVGLAGKGRIEVGADADLVALADQAEYRVTRESIRFRHPITPYLGRELTGTAATVWLRGTRLAPDMIAGRLLAPGDVRPS